LIHDMNGQFDYYRKLQYPRNSEIQALQYDLLHVL